MGRDRYQHGPDTSTSLSLFSEQEGTPSTDHLVLLVYRGSISHGTYDPDGIDDVDTLALYVEGWRHYLGFPKAKSDLSFDADRGSLDLAAHEFRKGVKLLMGANPNAWPLLFCPDHQVLRSSPVGDALRANRDLFLTRKVYHSFRGIARSNLKRMEKSTREGELPYEGYMGEKRKKKVREVGYDPKNASHLLRYLTMCREMVEDGEVRIDRTEVGDASLFREVKAGEWKFDRVVEAANTLEERIDAALPDSPLPETPDREAIEGLTVTLLETFFDRWMLR